MRQHLHAYLLFCLLMLALAPSTRAVLSDYESPRAAPGDPDYAAGMAAFKRADWQGVIDTLARVIERRPWHDDAYSLMGFAYRKRGDYRRALVHYQKALELNPHHRGALEYLGEAYLEMGCLAQANELLTRLETACKRITGDVSTGGWRSSCKEWHELKAAIDAYREPAKPGCAAD